MRRKELNKGFYSKFPVNQPDRYIPDEGWKAQRPKGYDNNHKEEDNIPHIKSVNNNSSFQKYKQ